MGEEIEELEGQEESSLMDDLAEAWDAAEAAEEPEAPVEEPDEADAPIKEPEDAPVEAAEAAPEEDGPPAALPPAAREAWKETPDAVKQHIAENEKRMESMAQKYGADANRARQMDQTLAPYQQLFAINGGAAQTLPGLLQTASVLQMGSPQQKAQQVAALIKQFGVDIQTLDGMLVGEAPPQEVQQQQQIDQIVNQRIQQYEQAQQQQRRQQHMHQVQDELQQFASNPQNEFYNDVKADMADILDMAANRNQDMTLEQAYQKAVALHPQISQIMSARQSQQSVSQKRQAASSISGGPGGSPQSAAPNSTRAAIEEAWENAGRM